MTGDVVNLRAFRKRKQRQDKQLKAAENRAKFGRSKAEKTRDEAEKNSHANHVDGHRIERADEDHDE